MGSLPKFLTTRDMLGDQLDAGGLKELVFRERDALTIL